MRALNFFLVLSAEMEFMTCLLISLNATDEGDSVWLNSMPISFDITLCFYCLYLIWSFFLIVMCDQRTHIESIFSYIYSVGFSHFFRFFWCRQKITIDNLRMKRPRGLGFWVHEIHVLSFDPINAVISRLNDQ